MAYVRGLECLNFPANADLSSYKFRVVELMSSGNVQLATLGKGIGVLQNIPKSGEQATVAIDGESKAVAGGAISIADHVRVLSGGWCVKINSGDLSGVIDLGMAMTAASSGGLFTVNLEPQLLANVVSGSIVQATP